MTHGVTPTCNGVRSGSATRETDWQQPAFRNTSVGALCALVLYRKAVVEGYGAAQVVGVCGLRTKTSQFRLLVADARVVPREHGVSSEQ